jgi:hypothetical protein
MSDEPLFSRPRALPLTGDAAQANRDEPEWPLLYQTGYCSRAVEGVDEAAVDQIIAASRKNNPAHAITGLLVFGSGVFFQWIEGPREQVQTLMGILQADARHERMVVLSESEESRERLFPDWDMELVEPDDIREVLQDALESAKDPHTAESLSVLLAQLESGGLRELGQS